MVATCKLPLIFVGLQCPLVRLSPFSSTRQPVRAVLVACQLPDEDITLIIPTRTSPIYSYTPLTLPPFFLSDLHFCYPALENPRHHLRDACSCYQWL
ncbi:hypothetical protein BDP81DRAFT_197683 [Colletotrichum phormii]|uniref:Uncharacterized protein n=1 Tax=Colletotrichum phormii TaxID=359342 RepID=A0AAJ0EHL6_9PEZI|nr:uncharacterized protein BDP81DRAFT_197683 [Colletotrichum phormii]KAK1639144.1 hypothetical protein BDP81DRAFT_197683 [Colletotrichum phormii]